MFECVDHFVGLALKGLTGGYDKIETESLYYFFGSTNQKGQGYKSGQYVSYLVNEGNLITCLDNTKLDIMSIERFMSRTNKSFFREIHT